MLGPWTFRRPFRRRLRRPGPRGVGAAVVTGTSALTLPAAESASVGVESIPGTSGVTLPAAESASVGVESIPGTSGVTLPAVDSASVGVESIPGTSGLTLPAVDSASVGVESIPGTSGVTLPAVDSASLGTAGGPTGTADVTLAAAESAAVGVESIPGTSALSLPAILTSAVGVEVFVGTSALTLPTVDSASVGISNITGTADLTLPAVDSASVGVETIDGTSGLALPAISSKAIDSDISGTSSLTLPSAEAFSTDQPVPRPPGCPIDMTELRRTNRVQAINQMLQAIGSNSVSTIEEGSNPTDVDIALEVLDETTRDVLNEGWHFNMEFKCRFLPDLVTKKIQLPDDVVRIDASRCSGLIAGPNGLPDLVYRHGFVYDKRNHTFEIGAAEVFLDIVRFIDFVDLPQAARSYVTAVAARKFHARVLGDALNRRGLIEDEKEAKARLMREEHRTAQSNSMNSFISSRIAGRRSPLRQIRPR